MRSRLMMMVALGAIALQGCSGKAEKKPDKPVFEKSNIKVVFEPAVKPSADPKETERRQVAIVDTMLHDPLVPLDVIEGEALRRHVVLTDDQRAAKNKAMGTKSASPVGAPPAAPSAVPPSGAAPAK